MELASLILKAMRPKQWTKNLLLFAGLVFSHHLADAHRVLAATAGFAIFCTLSGAVYLYNDIRDRDNDRQHPLKCRRPIASGALPVSVAVAATCILVAAGLTASLAVNVRFAGFAAFYLVLMLAYSSTLKHVVVLDLIVVAMGFVIRGVAGVKAIELPNETIPITPWFVTCVLFLALFIVLCKRRHELVLLSEDAAGHRPVLEHYSTVFVDQMVSVATSASVISYALYVTLGTKKEEIPHSDLMIWTLPFVLFGIFRYLYLVYRREEGGSPEALFLQDWPLLASVVAWLVAVTILIYA